MQVPGNTWGMRKMWKVFKKGEKHVGKNLPHKISKYSLMIEYSWNKELLTSKRVEIWRWGRGNWT